MKKEEFSSIRKSLKKTQRQIALLLGISHKTVESYEQGFRNVPVNIERILYYLLFKLNMNKLDVNELCWHKKDCPLSIRRHCVAWLANEGFFCWFLTGKTCVQERMLSKGESGNCFSCSFFLENLANIY
jgi:transcriptional regulator with XRE-family HTH domain